jgi:hypothetical protein
MKKIQVHPTFEPHVVRQGASAWSDGISVVSPAERIQLAVALESSGLSEETRRRIMERTLVGVSHEDTWNTDGFVAAILATALYHYAVTGEGHTMENFYPDAEDAAEARKADLLKRADVFAHFWRGDTWSDKEDARKYGGVTKKQLNKALAWLTERYEYLWD